MQKIQTNTTNEFKHEIEVLSQKQVAALLKVSVKTVYNHVVKGTFPAPAMVLGRPR